MLNCSGPGGSGQQSTTVTVSGSPPPAPTVTLNANPTSVQSGATSQLSWSSANATSCTASGGWTGAKLLSGSQSVGPLARTTSFALSCTGAGGSAQRSVTVASPPHHLPTVALSADPTSVQSGGGNMLTGRATSIVVQRRERGAVPGRLAVKAPGAVDYEHVQS
jgi:hypothetical protein